jgi:hypothetical protein
MLIFAVSETARGDWTIASSASLSHDSNVGNAQHNADTVADSSAAARLSLLDLMPLGANLSLAAGGDVSGQSYDRLSGLNNASFDGVLSLKKKWSIGAFAPWSRVGVSAGRANYDDGYRDAAIYRAAIETGKRLDERWNLWAKYAFEHRAADPVPSDLYGVSSNVFTLTGRSFNAGVQYAASERLALSMSGLLRRGDVVSTSREYAGIYRASTAIAPDPTFGADAYAYRLYGKSFGARVGAEFSLNAHNLVGAGFQRLQTHGRGGNDYGDSLAEVTWNYRL